jgi:5-methylthioadenosine/S-adenosylhomocysteine deaminase
LNPTHISAGFLYPVSSPAIVDGAVLISEDGKIAAVGPDQSVPRPEGVISMSFPSAVLLPGLVNAHTHLELTTLGGRCNDREFFDWIQNVRQSKAELAPEEFEESARCGVRDAWRHGVTTVADTGDSGAVARALAELRGRGIVYQEVFGPHPLQADEAFAELVTTIERLHADAASDDVHIGVSPHAPYSVSGALFSRVAQFARNEGLPIAVHVAESREESALVTGGAGPFAASWRERGVPEISLARSPVAYLHGLGVLDASPLAIHAVQADSDDAELLASHGCAVALCPRSNARHGHGAAPVTTFLEAEIPCGVGTDSVASVDSLDLFQDAQRVRRLAGLSAPQTVRLMTLDGATALGIGDVGSLEVGKWADLCAIEISPGDDVTDEGVAERLLARTARDILLTCVGGRQVHEAAPVGGRPAAQQNLGEIA